MRLCSIWRESKTELNFLACSNSQRGLPINCKWRRDTPLPLIFLMFLVNIHGLKLLGINYQM